MTEVNTSKAVALQLRTLIIDGAFEHGGALRQSALSKRLGVSRTPLREALQMLSGQGLVTMSDNKGARVARLDRQGLADLFEMRTALEPLALRSAFPTLTKLDLARAEIAIDKSETETSPVALLELNLEFHMALYEPSRRPLLLETITTLNRRAELAEAISYSIGVRPLTSRQEHALLVSACRVNDPQAAEDILISHLRSAHNDALAALEG